MSLYDRSGLEEDTVFCVHSGQWTGRQVSGQNTHDVIKGIEGIDGRPGGAEATSPLTDVERTALRR